MARAGGLPLPTITDDRALGAVDIQRSLRFNYNNNVYLCFRKELVDPLKLKSNGWSQQAEILATSVNKSKIFYEVPISYSGRTFEEGKKIKARHTFSVIYMIIKKRLF